MNALHRILCCALLVLGGSLVVLGDDAVARLQYGAKLRAQGKPAEARAWVEHSLKIRPSYEGQLERGRIWFDLGETNRAIVDFQAASRLEPRQAEPHWLLAKAWWKKGNLEAAESEFTTALAEQPNYRPAALHRGYLRLARKNPEGAMEDGGLAIDLEPDDATGYALRGRARQAMSDLMGAEADFDMAVKLAPTDADAYVRRADVRLMVKNDTGAWEDAEAIRRLDPTNAHAYRLRAKVYLLRGHASQAEQELQAALRLAKSDQTPKILFDRAIARLAQTRDQEAIADLAEAVKLAPDQATAFTEQFETALQTRGR